MLSWPISVTKIVCPCFAFVFNIFNEKHGLWILHSYFHVMLHKTSLTQQSELKKYFNFKLWTHIQYSKIYSYNSYHISFEPHLQNRSITHSYVQFPNWGRISHSCIGMATGAGARGGHWGGGCGVGNFFPPFRNWAGGPPPI